MPVCNIAVSEEVDLELTDSQLNSIREVVALGLDSSARRLDYEHVVVRVSRGRGAHMLGQVELEVFGQFYLRRFLSRDARAKRISHEVGKLLNVDVATWIHLVGMGYARVTTSGRTFFSD